MCRDSQYNRDMFSPVFFQALGLEERTLFFILSRKTKSVRQERQKKIGELTINLKKRNRRETERKKSVTQRCKTKRNRGEAKKKWCVFISVYVARVVFHQ